MARTRHRPAPSAPAGRALLAVSGCTLFFAALAMTPAILPVLHLNLHPTAPRTSYGVTLMVAPRYPHAVHLPPVAWPVAPGKAPATPPAGNAAGEAAFVTTEDERLRAVLHTAPHIYRPQVVSAGGSRPTLILPAGPRPYTQRTLAAYGALVMLARGKALLTDNVYVSTGATLDLGSPSLRTLYLASGRGGFATIVGWGGDLSFAGTAAHPLTITGWDRAAGQAARSQRYGRSYIREVGGKMLLTQVRVSSLGFWSGRTGGVAWTGLSGSPSTGGAADSAFTGDTYGAFVSRGAGVTFSGDRFEYNQLDGLHVHRYSELTSAVSSSAVRNGGDGFAVSPAADGTRLENDIAQHNEGSGFYLDGRPLATGASAAGGSVAPGTGTVVEYGAALGNGKLGVLVEGGRITVVKGDQVCGGSTAIEVKDGAEDAVVTGDTISCAARSGISVGPSAPGTVLAGNAVYRAGTAFLIRDSSHVELDKNLVTGATVFGVSARGATSSVSGVDNTISGSGFRAIDTRADAAAFSLYGSDLDGWTYHAPAIPFSYLEFHPLAALWLSVATLLLLAFGWTRLRAGQHDRPSHPYPASTRWRPPNPPAGPAGLWEPAAAGQRPWPAPAVRRPATQQPDGQYGYRPAFPRPRDPVASQPVTRLPGRVGGVARGAAETGRPPETVPLPVFNRNGGGSRR